MKKMGAWEYHVSITAAILAMLVFLNGIAKVQSQSQQVSAMFVFGDSLVDVGNNNFLVTWAKANFFPYGIDFSSRRSTGRFSNARCLVDFLGEMVGVPSPPPFREINTGGGRILNGVNFASAASGILDESGRHYGQRYNLNQQVLNFENILRQYRTMMKNGTTLNQSGITLNQFLAKSIAVVVTGSNDYINNYLMPSVYRSSSNYTSQQFGNLLVTSLARQILTLHSLGLRKFFLAGVGPIGCIPYIRANFNAPTGRCVDSINQMIGTFNEGLRSMVDQLNRNYPDSVFVYGNTYRVLGEILNNPASYGFRVIDAACCGVGRNRGQISCLPFQFPCANRSEFVFWDAFHPTESAIYVFAWRAVHGNLNDAYPINFQQLALK